MLLLFLSFCGLLKFLFFSWGGGLWDTHVLRVQSCLFAQNSLLADLGDQMLLGHLGSNTDRLPARQVPYILDNFSNPFFVPRERKHLFRVFIERTFIIFIQVKEKLGLERVLD